MFEFSPSEDSSLRAAMHIELVADVVRRDLDVLRAADGVSSGQETCQRKPHAAMRDPITVVQATPRNAYLKGMLANGGWSFCFRLRGKCLRTGLHLRRRGRHRHTAVVAIAVAIRWHVLLFCSCCCCCCCCCFHRTALTSVTA